MPSGGGGEHDISTIQVGNKHTGSSGLGDMEVTEYIARIRRGLLEERTTEARSMADYQSPSLLYF